MANGPVFSFKNTSVGLKFDGANPRPTITGEDKLPGSSNYLIGSDQRHWKIGVEHFARVRYQNLYRESTPFSMELTILSNTTWWFIRARISR